MSSVYRGSFTNETWYAVTKDGVPFSHEPSLDVRNHSPTGFAWGYAGSGPAQLSLALLLDVTKNKHLTKRLYMQYKDEVIAGLPNNEGDTWEITSDQVAEWVLKQVEGVG